jgi:hypothetical protein
VRDVAFVTGCVGVEPGSAKAADVKEAFVAAAKQGRSTIYVVGSLFAPGTSKDAMIVFLESLPGRKVLVTEGGYSEPAERLCGAWHDMQTEVRVTEWGRKMVLSCDPRRYPDECEVLFHVGSRPDGGDCIRVRWDDLYDRYGPKGLHSLYALSVLASQFATGFVAEEPVDGS